ncbi:FtsB family cell division protein [Candidatus Pelagibacter communis]|uniref:FtsB family cell division protein n=1 Tax=Pelagibacter ubique TaxID=198252 RepID=UPI00094CDBC3|nr:septum formation initiator family protein [Candidatus Pelagibacter ubique]
MIKKIKNKLIFILPILLILYFILNLFGGNRGLFSYFEKRNYLNNLKNEVKIIRQEIEDLEKSNILLSDNIDADYIEILLRDKFLLGKKGETVYIIKNE